MKLPSHICGHCGQSSCPQTHTPGSFGVEAILWLCCLIPGVIYSDWRLRHRHWICPDCRSTDLVGLDTPRGRQLHTQYGAQPQ